MASTIRIKRSGAAGNPGTLAAGELAYSALSDTGSGPVNTTGGDRLYIGFGSETSGNAANHIVIGGKYFTDMMDHERGTLTASSAIITDADNKIDVINIGNITITGSTNTISSTYSNGDIYLVPNGTGLVNINNAYSLPATNGTAGYVLTSHSDGKATWAAPSTTLTLATDGASGTNVNIDLLTETLTIAGTSAQGISTSANGPTGNTITITASDASDTQKGVATFNTSGFVVTTGNVALKANVAQSFTGTSGTATPALNALAIVGDSTSGVSTLASSAQVAISVGKATSGQLGVSKYSASYITVTDGDVAINAATATTLGIAKFPTSYFDVSAGSVTIVDASSTVKGAASFDVNTLTVTAGNVKVNDITLGTSTLTPGSTTSSVLGLNEITVGNLQLENNTISTTDSNGNLVLAPAGTGLVSIANAYTLPRVAGSTGYVLTTDGSGGSSWQQAAASLKFKDDTGTEKEVKLLTGDLLINGDGTTIHTAATNGTGDDKIITITIDKATTSSVGVASFKSDTFTVTSGEVDVKAGGITNTQLVNSKVTVGTTDISLGSSSTTLAGLTDVTIGKVQITDLGGINAKTGNLDLDSTSGFIKINGYYTLPNSAGTSGYALITDGLGNSDWTEISTTLMIAGDTGTDTLNLITDTLTFDGDATQGVSTTVTGSTVGITVASATTTTLGVAAFSSSDFGVNLGSVSLDGSVVKSVVGDTGTLTPSSHSFNVNGDSAAISTSATGSTLTVSARIASTSVTGVASFSSTNFTVSAGGAVTSNKFTIGSTDFNLGQAATTTIAGLTNVTIGDIRIYDDNKIEFVNSGITDGDIVLVPKGAGTVDVSDSRITGVADPTSPTDAANRRYVDNVAAGLHVHKPAQVATTGTLKSITSSATAVYADGPTPSDPGIGATITLSTAITSLDGVLLTDPDYFPADGVGRILVKDEGLAGGLGGIANGVYTLDATRKILTRATDFDTPVEVHGGDFVFIVYGTKYGSTGWVQQNDTDAIGTDVVDFTQFAGAGTYIEGNGLRLNGNEFSVKLSAVAGTDEAKSGLEFSGSELHVAGTIAGNGLTYSDGVLTIGGTTDRITVSADSVDIASTYAGQNSITTLGTITTGTWHADTIGSGYGGTGFSTYAKGDLLYASAANTLSQLTIGTEGQVFQVNSSGLPVWADLDGGTY